MFKISIEDYKNNFKVIKSFYMEDYKDVINYLTETFPYADNINEKLDNSSTFESLSFCLSINKEAFFGINIEKIKYRTIKEKPKAWGGSDYSIIEVFPFIEAYEVMKQFEVYMNKMKELEDCVDSFRIGLKDNVESMKEYDALISCCGSNNTDVIINEKTYVFGCNYGH